jgi:hypothetical protein
MTLKSVALSMTLIVAALCPAIAADDVTQAEIRRALRQWTTGFNAGKADKACELFEPDVIADIRGEPEQNYRIICDRFRDPRHR